MIVESVEGLDNLEPGIVVRSIEHTFAVAVRTENGWNQTLTEYYDRPSSELEWLLPVEVLWSPA